MPLIAVRSANVADRSFWAGLDIGPDSTIGASAISDGDQIYVTPCGEVTYFHIMFDQHEIIFAEGAPSESFFVGGHLADADKDTHVELIDLFPELSEGTHPSQYASRRFLRSFEAVLLKN